MDESVAEVYEFGAFRLDARKRQLMKDEQVIALPSKAYETLLVLLQNSGRVIEREEMLRLIWRETIVEEANLTVCISILRKALGDSSAAGGYIVTVPGHGYQFAASVRRLSGEGDEIVIARPTHSRARTRADELEAERQRNSIAVLPFRRLGLDRPDEYLGLGIADSLITSLSNIRDLIVRPTSSVMRFADQDQDPVAAGHVLNVESVLEGTIRRVGDRVRVTAQLVGINEGRTLWAAKFDEKFADIFLIEDRVSEQIANALALELPLAARRRAPARGASNAEAYELLIKGRYHFNEATWSGLEKAIEYLGKAVEMDPSFAMAYAGLADSHIFIAMNSELRPNDLLFKARGFAKRALELDENLAEAHASLALVKMSCDWDWLGAEGELRLASALNPNRTPVKFIYSFYHSLHGHHDQAIACATQAQEFDPLSLMAHTQLGLAFYRAGRDDEAIRVCQKSLEANPSFAFAHRVLGLAYESKGNYQAAIAEFHKAALELPRSTSLVLLGYAYAMSGRRDDAIGLLGELTDRAGRVYVSPTAFATLHAGLGDVTRSFEWLEQAYQERDYRLLHLIVSGRTERLRPDLRYGNLLNRMGLPQ